MHKNKNSINLYELKETQQYKAQYEFNLAQDAALLGVCDSH